MMQGNHQPQQPVKQHITMDYMIYDESINFTKSDKFKEDFQYTLHFTYTSGSDLLCSAFTFVEESFNIDTYTTENVVADKKNGSEKHVALAAGDNKNAVIDPLKIVMKENYNFTSDLINNYYPLIIRLVDIGYEGK